MTVIKIFSALCVSIFILVPSLHADVDMTSFDYIYSKALLLKTNSKYEESINTLNLLLDKKINKDRVYFQIASCYQLSHNNNLAIEFARKSISSNPKFTDPYILIYSICLEDKKTDDAAEVLADLLEENPSLYQYHYNLGILYYQYIENYKLAADSFKSIINISKTTPIPSYYKEQSFLLLSEISFLQKDYPRAIEALDEAVKINIRNNARFYRYASTLLNSGYYETSKICLEKFIGNLPANQKTNKVIQQLYSYLGNIYYITNDNKALTFLRLGAGKEIIEEEIASNIYNYEINNSIDSLKFLENISSSQNYSTFVTPHIALAKENIKKNEKEKAYQGYLNIGYLLSKTDMLPNAAQYFLEAHKLKDTEKEPIGYLAQLYEQMGDKQLAVLYFKKYLSYDPDFEISLHLAFLYDLMGEKSKCDILLDSLIKNNSTNPRAYFIKGLVLSKRENYKEAELFLLKAIELKSNDSSYYYYLATIYEKINKKNEAESALQQAIKFDNQNASYKNFLGYLYADAGIQLDDANRLIEEALKNDPFNGAYIDSLGWVLFKKGNTDLAIKKLKLAMRILQTSGESDSVIFDHLGEAYLKKGNKKKAVLYWKKSLELKKDPMIEKKISLVEKK